MSERSKGKSIGRRASPKAEAAPAARAAPAAAKPSPRKSAKGTKAASPRARATGSIELKAAEMTLLEALAARTKLSLPEVVARALQSYAAAVAPELQLRSAPPREESDTDTERLFISVDGRPEIQILQPEFVLGSGAGCDLQLNLPLIAERHARILLRDGRHLFEDLRSPKGSYRHGQLVDVRFLEDGDEIDLGGFLPIRFRLERIQAGM